MKLYKENQLKIYNSLSKTKEAFKPVHDGHIGMYVCGPKFIVMHISEI